MDNPGSKSGEFVRRRMDDHVGDETSSELPKAAAQPCPVASAFTSLVTCPLRPDAVAAREAKTPAKSEGPRRRQQCAAAYSAEGIPGGEPLPSPQAAEPASPAPRELQPSRSGFIGATIAPTAGARHVRAIYGRGG